MNISHAITSIRTGTYTGDDTENKAIDHGLGRTPSLVLIFAAGIHFVLDCLGGTSYLGPTSSGTKYSVTHPTSVSFYVGDAVSYQNSANQNAITYSWVAFA